MEHEFARGRNAAVRRALASQMGCDAAAFSQERLTLVARPEPPVWPFTAMIVDFGTGTVVSVEARYLDWARAAAPEPHYRASYLVFLTPFVEEGARRGERLAAQTAGLGWSLARPPEALPVPGGLRLERVDAAWMAAWQPRDLFHNALGDPNEAHRTERNHFACVLFDGDQPVGAAGAFDTAGMLEVGIDVDRAQRGRGLAPLLVSELVRDILDQGNTPFYACVATNIRSQRTALASGFLPACSLASVVPAEQAIGGE